MIQGYINSIYRATEGEGIHVGTPQVFVRLQGCAVGCLNCDSIDTWAFDQGGTSMDLSEVLDEVFRQSLDGRLSRVSITGGDPLHPKHVPFVKELVLALKSLGKTVVLEAAGTRVVHEIFDHLDFINMDVKTPSTGVKTRLEVLKELFVHYPGRFQIKAVVSDERDFAALLETYNAMGEQALLGSWVITPAYNLGEEFPLERFQSIIEWNYSSGGLFRVIGQQHKWLYGPDRKFI
jgi:7-carboxy-7-deazaguanine synthase